ncbi:MAG: hypothetical protein RJA36_1861 [Pseudomonadota bacterium]
MRPQSEIRIELAAALIDGGGTTKQLAQRTGWSITLTMWALKNMVSAGDARKARTVRVPGVKRPVPWYERAERAAAVAPSGEPYISLIAAWSRCGPDLQPQHADTEAAM